MNIGQKVRELRIAKNLTQEELADRSELSKGFISQLERDLTSPSIATLVDILQCLGTNLNEFFSDDEEEQVVFGDEDYFEKKDTDLKDHSECPAQYDGTDPSYPGSGRCNLPGSSTRR